VQQCFDSSVIEKGLANRCLTDGVGTQYYVFLSSENGMQQWNQMAKYNS